MEFFELTNQLWENPSLIYTEGFEERYANLAYEIDDDEVYEVMRETLDYCYSVGSPNMVMTYQEWDEANDD